MERLQRSCTSIVDDEELGIKLVILIDNSHPDIEAVYLGITSGTECLAGFESILQEIHDTPNLGDKFSSIF